MTQRTTNKIKQQRKGKKMSFIDTLKGIAQGATVGVIAVTALPLFGAVGTITAVGTVVGATVGGIAGAIDASNQD
jgi:hypothetical protein